MANGLSAKQLVAFKAKLAALHDALTQQESEAAKWRVPVELDQQSVGRLSRMDAMQQQAMSEAEGRRRQIDIQRIKAALERVADAEYGWCAECGEAIALKRLEIDPMATHCIRCAR